MLTSIGKRPTATGLVAALLDCHERIRRFTGLSRRLADTTGAPEADVRELAGRIHFYFTRGLPEHVADEEETLLPRLRGRSPEVDQALATMHAQHASHAAPLARLLELLGTLHEAPERHAAVAPELSQLAARLEAEFAEHLEIEERVIFPALAALPADLQAEMQRENRARRG